ncbi:MAG: SufE family protein [Fimbriimonas sp.]|nr:SufE family protein [Fimbriimonas sp.]
MSTLQQRAEEIAEELSYLDREERFEWIIDTGKELKTADDFQDHELVKGCQSKVWLRVWQEENNLRIIGTSDALLVKGIVSLLISIFDNATIDESKSFDFIEWMNKNQISLSMQRMQGLEGMLRRIQG